jgi:hypothetical protein
MRYVWFLVLFIFGGCNHAASGLGPPAADGSGSGSGSVDGGTGDAGDPSLALGVTITNLGPGRFEIDSTTNASVSLRTHTSIEQLDASGVFQPIESRLGNGMGYRLLETCPDVTDDGPQCVDLAPGGSFVPVRWTGFNCSAQCSPGCHANSFEGPGKYRLVVTACDGSARVVGPMFELPLVDVLLERWGVTTDVTSATALRLDLPHGGTGEVAGFVARSGSEQPLDKGTIDELVALLRNPHGFDDIVVKRCAMQHLVGVRLTRTLPTTGRAPRTVTTDVALDFTCQKIFTADGDAKHRVTSGGHFDPTRPAFVRWVKRAFPSDAEIQLN